MEHLIPIQTRLLNEQPTEFVNARELHSFLGVGRDFSNWIKNRIKQYCFINNEDYICVENLSSPKRASAKSRVQKINDYLITLDMAKELAMVELH